MMRSPKLKSKSNEELVLDVVAKSDKPLSAYDILEKLARFGISGPPTVYRALEKLMKAGQIHRIQSINAFVACHKEANCKHTHHNTFTVCSDCGGVEEIHDDRIASLIESISKTRRFQVEQQTIELVGRCASCVSKGAH